MNFLNTIISELLLDKTS